MSQYLFFLLILACPLMMVFMMRGGHGHGAHGGHGGAGSGSHGQPDGDAGAHTGEHAGGKPILGKPGEPAPAAARDERAGSDDRRGHC